MLKLENARIKQDSFVANYTADFRENTLYCIHGPSGSGKSTLLSTITGFNKLQSGKISFNEKDLSPMKIEDRPCSVLFQGNNLFQHLSVMDNIKLGSNHKEDAIHPILDRLNLTDKANELPTKLSGGEQQRVAIARMILMDRDIMLFDEPFTGLDLKQQLITAQLIHELVSPEKIVILTSHQQDPFQNIDHQAVDLMDIVTYI